MLTDYVMQFSRAWIDSGAVGPLNITVQTSLGILRSLSDSCGKEFRLPRADVTNFYFDLFSKTSLTTGIAEKTFGQPA
jgi:hypothetical protein